MSPCYEYKCPNGHVSEQVRPISEYQEGSVCPVCKQQSTRIISQTQRTEVFWPHFDLQLGQHFKTSKQRREYLKENNLEGVSKREVESKISNETL